MRTEQALSILRPEGNTLDDLKRSYWEAAKKYHPDINPDGLELMKVVNAAYDHLKKHLDQWSFQDRDLNKQGIDEIFSEILDKIRHIPNINIEVCGVWLWITGDTKPYKETFKELGLRFAPKKEAWYWRPEKYRSRNKGRYSLQQIRNLYGSQDIQNETLYQVH
jgi:hypothetical protein